MVVKLMLRALNDCATVDVCSTLAEALGALADGRQPWAAIVDVALPDGSGLAVLEALATRVPPVPALVTTGHRDRDTIAAAQRLGAQYMPKPIDKSGLLAFVQWAERWQSIPQERLRNIVTGLTERYGLSARESEIVLLVATGVAPADLHDAMGVSVNTVKTLTRRALRKCGASSLTDLVAPIHRSLLGESAAPLHAPEP
jgi:DNA-binding NarL/FixJ family response regulator